ncbi:MAG: hypothetical protein QNJ54_16845 [Prochloraceae cyanobacterium]|nr:hypothetical protein [Prochloraceae cyanobacterium]
MFSLNYQVKELKLYDNQIETSALVSEIVDRFKSNPTLLGAIVFSNSKFVTMISQKLFWKYMSLPYSLELSSKRSIKYLVDLLNTKNFNLIVSEKTLITEAAKKSLERAAKFLEEPILVKITPQ